MNALKRCPFCGSEAQLLIVPGRVAHWVVRCSKGCCNTCQYISDHDAEEEWNKRTVEEHSEIVRCKDCTFRNEINCPQYYRRNELPDDWYCADGERRKGDG